MNHEFGVTIATTLCDKEICGERSFDHVAVIDLRRCVNNGPYPVEETTLRKLRNHWVRYQQQPMSLRTAGSRKENMLFQMITEQRGNVLIVTDEPVPLARFCQQLDIPYTSKDLFIVETASDYIPVQVPPKAGTASSFGSLAG